MGKGRPSPLRLRKRRRSASQRPSNAVFEAQPRRRRMAARRCLRLRRKKEGHARRGRKAPRARRKRSLRYAKGGIACEGHGRAENAVGLGCAQRVPGGTHGRAGNEAAMRAIALAFCERPAGRRKCFRLRLRTNAFRENLPGAQEARPRVRRTTAVACEGLPAVQKARPAGVSGVSAWQAWRGAARASNVPGGRETAKRRPLPYCRGRRV